MWNWIASKFADITASIKVYISVTVNVVINTVAKLSGRR